jgi:hypothetical protein
MNYRQWIPAPSNRAGAALVLRSAFSRTRSLGMLAAVSSFALAGLALPPVSIAQVTASPTAVHELENKHQHVPSAAANAVSPLIPNPNCNLRVPLHPLSAQGLATPYELFATDPSLGPCNEANGAQAAFVQAAILDPATGSIVIYSPLVIDRGTRPAAPVVVPTLPANAIVALWFGFNGNNLQLHHEIGGQDERFLAEESDSHCVNGSTGSVFSQYAYCNAAAFYRAAAVAIRSKLLVVPPLGVAADGAPCPTTRDFFIVDQDQSDNLPTTYLAVPSGRMAQNTVTNRATLASVTQIGNPSDNRLTDVFVDAAMGCSAWKAPDLADPGQIVPALALNELQAKAHQETPVALVPVGDPMTEENGVYSLHKNNLYRIGVDQPLVTAEGDADTGRYCRQILRVAPNRYLINQAALTAESTPDATAGNSLFTFMAQRLVNTYQILNCQTLTGQLLPLTTVVNAAGVTIAATVDPDELMRILTALEPQRAQDDIADAGSRTR